MCTLTNGLAFWNNSNLNSMKMNSTGFGFAIICIWYAQLKIHNGKPELLQYRLRQRSSTSKFFTFKSSSAGVKRYEESKNDSFLSYDVARHHYDVINVKILIAYFSFKSSLERVKRYKKFKNNFPPRHSM